MTYDNLFKDRATWGRSYGCILSFVNEAGAAVDMSSVSGLSMGFKSQLSDANTLFDLKLNDGLSWLNNDSTTGQLIIMISRERMSLVTYDAASGIGNEVPVSMLFSDLKLAFNNGGDILYDEGTVPKLFLAVEQQVTAL